MKWKKQKESKSNSFPHDMLPPESISCPLWYERKESKSNSFPHDIIIDILHQEPVPKCYIGCSTWSIFEYITTGPFAGPLSPECSDVKFWAIIWHKSVKVCNLDGLFSCLTGFRAMDDQVIFDIDGW